MFCQKCGTFMNDNERFCPNCGNRVTEAATEPAQIMNADANAYGTQSFSAGQGVPQQPTQPAPSMGQAYPQQPQEGAFYQGQMPMGQGYPQQGMPMGQNYPQQGVPMGQGFPQQPTSPEFQTGAPVQPVKKKGSGLKKGLIIGGSVVGVAAIGVGGFFLYKALSPSEFVKDNPTKAVYNSYNSYLAGRKDDTADLFTVLQGMSDSGYISVGVDTQEMSPTFKVAYDKTTNEYYLQADVGEMANVQMYTDSQKVFSQYTGATGSADFYIDFANFRNDMSKSIFAPTGGNALGMSQKDFDSMVSTVEKLYKSLKELPAKEQEQIDKYIQIIEKYSKPVTSEETIEVLGSKRDVYTVTYTLDQSSVASMLKDYFATYTKAITEYTSEMGITEAQLDEMMKEMTGMSDEMANNIPAGFQLTYTHCFDRNTQMPAKTSLTMKNYSTDSSKDGDMVMVMEYADSKDINISLSLDVAGDNGGSAKGNLTKTKEGSAVVYTLNFSEKGNRESKEKNGIFKFVYDDASKTYNVSAKIGDEAEQSFGGSAEITKDTVRFSYQPDTKTTLNIELSSVPKITKLTSQNNLLTMSMEEITKLMAPISSLSQLFGGMTPSTPDWPDDIVDDDDFDYNDFDYSQLLEDYDFSSMTAMLTSLPKGMTSVLALAA